MVLEPHAAAQFIKGYKAILLEIGAQESGNSPRRALEKLAAAREQLYKDRSLLKKGLNRVKAKVPDISPAVIQAVEDLEVEPWIYLRDTKRHSIFIHPKGHCAFGVLGLTEPIRDVAGGPSMSRAGVEKLAVRSDSRCCSRRIRSACEPRAGHSGR